MLTSYLEQVVTNIFFLFAVAAGTRGLSAASTKRHSSPARRCRNLRRCKMRRGERILFHEQGCAPSVSRQGFSRTTAPLQSSVSVAVRAPPRAEGTMSQHPALLLIREGIAAQNKAPVLAPVVAQAPTHRPAPAPVPVFWEPQQSVPPTGVSSRESRDPAGDGRLPSEKDLSTVDRLLLRVIQSWRLADPSIGRASKANQKLTQIASAGRETCCRFLLCQLQKLSLGIRAKGTLIC